MKWAAVARTPLFSNGLSSAPSRARRPRVLDGVRRPRGGRRLETRLSHQVLVVVHRGAQAPRLPARSAPVVAQLSAVVEVSAGASRARARKKG